MRLSHSNAPTIVIGKNGAELLLSDARQVNCGPSLGLNLAFCSFNAFEDRRSRFFVDGLAAGC